MIKMTKEQYENIVENIQSFIFLNIEDLTYITSMDVKGIENGLYNARSCVRAINHHLSHLESVVESYKTKQEIEEHILEENGDGE